MCLRSRRTRRHLPGDSAKSVAEDQDILVFDITKNAQCIYAIRVIVTPRRRDSCTRTLLASTLQPQPKSPMSRRRRDPALTIYACWLQTKNS
jgi:hypothetical protein